MADFCHFSKVPKGEVGKKLTALEVAQLPKCQSGSSSTLVGRQIESNTTSPLRLPARFLEDVDALRHCETSVLCQTATSTPIYSITSSASASTLAGSSRPMDFAVFKLIATTQYYFVYIHCGTSRKLKVIRRVGHEASRHDRLSVALHGGQSCVQASELILSRLVLGNASEAMGLNIRSRAIRVGFVPFCPSPFSVQTWTFIFISR
jgi:hypothetical protein